MWGRKASSLTWRRSLWLLQWQWLAWARILYQVCHNHTTPLLLQKSFLAQALIIEYLVPARKDFWKNELYIVWEIIAASNSQSKCRYCQIVKKQLRGNRQLSSSPKCSVAEKGLGEMDEADLLCQRHGRQAFQPGSWCLLALWSSSLYQAAWTVHRSFILIPLMGHQYSPCLSCILSFMAWQILLDSRALKEKAPNRIKLKHFAIWECAFFGKRTGSSHETETTETLAACSSCLQKTHDSFEQHSIPLVVCQTSGPHLWSTYIKWWIA